MQVLYALLSDLVYLKAGTRELGLRNPDLRSQLEALGQEVSWTWLADRVSQLDQVDRGQRRNVNRQLALDSWALGAVWSGPDS